MIYNNLGGVRLGIDDNGNYGYKKVGADSVTPFSSPFEIILKAIPTYSYYGKGFFIINTDNYKKINIIHNSAVHVWINVYTGLNATGGVRQVAFSPGSGAIVDISGSKSFEIVVQENDLSKYIKAKIS